MFEGWLVEIVQIKCMQEHLLSSLPCLLGNAFQCAGSGRLGMVVQGLAGTLMALQDLVRASQSQCVEWAFSGKGRENLKVLWKVRDAHEGVAPRV